MIKASISKNVNYSLKNCHDLITDVNKYPYFLSNVNSVNIQSKNSKKINYTIYHKYNLISTTDTINYNMCIDDNRITVVGKDSKYVDSLKYIWTLKSNNEKNTLIRLDAIINLNDERLIPMVYTFKDILLQKNVNEFTSALINYSKE